jgi:hypothetical protein
MGEPNLKMTLKGLDDAVKQMARIERGLKSLRNYTGVVYSRLPYSYGIEYGRHRVSGKLARRAGGSFYIRRAIDTVLAGADQDLSEGLEKVTAPGQWVIRRLALWARRLARQNVPRGPKKGKSHSYRLSRSIRYAVRKGRGE